jgi:serine phosphatase RsbU (regulator of sigma subunit)
MAKFRLRWPEAHTKDLRALPTRVFAALMLGVVLLVSSVWIDADLLAGLQRPLWWTIAGAALFGLVTVFSIAVGRDRKARLMLVPVVLAFGFLMRTIQSKIPTDRALFAPALEQIRLRMAKESALAMGTVLAGYAIFLRTIATEVARHIRTRAELVLAEQVQQSLAPPLALKSAGYEVQGRSAPSSQMGGDLLDAVVEPGAVAVYVSDVAGHGIQAGVFMGMVKSSVHAALLRRGTLAELLGDLNRVIFEVKTSPATYVTFACLRCGEDGRVEYSLAGSGPILHYRARLKTTDLLAMEQFPLGMFAKGAFQSGVVQIEPGDILAVMTDGIPETVDSSDQQFGLDGIGEILAANPAGPLDQLVESVFTAVRRHGPQTDDETLVLVRAAV